MEPYLTRDVPGLPPAFLTYDQTRSARFVVARQKAVTLYNQNSLLTDYPGAVGGKQRARWCGRAQTNALRPVMARPTTRVLISLVPS